MGIMAVDDSFKRPGNVPFSWEIRPGVPKTRVSQPSEETTTTSSLHPPKKLSPLRLKPLSHSQTLLLPALSPPSSSFISNSKSRRPLSPLTPPPFSAPSKLKPKPPRSGIYSPGPSTPSFRSSPRAFSERWQLHRRDRTRDGSESEPRSDFAVAGLGCFPSPKFRLRKNKSDVRRKPGSISEREYCSDMETMSPWTVSSRRSVSPMWDSPKSSFSSLRFSSPRILNEAEWVGFGLF